MNVRVVSFYTSHEYQKHADKLALSCSRFGLDYTIVQKPDLGSWHANVCQKPGVILEALRAFPDEAIFWTDADSEFKRAPNSHWGTTWDTMIAAHFFQRSPAIDPEMLTGSILFTNTPLVRHFVETWARLTPNFEQNDRPELVGWQAAIVEWGLLAPEVTPLGPEWCFIHDDMRELHPDCDPIIMHYQASRVLNRDGLRREQR